MAVGVNIVSTFDSKGIQRAIKDFQKIEGAGNKATFGLRTVDKAFTNGAKNVAKYGGLLAAGLGVAATQMVKGAEFAKQADDRLVAVAKSMGLFGTQAQFVTARLIKLADAQEYELGVTAETIKLTQAKLLTFKELAVTADEVGGAFDRATVAAVDLAAAGFGEASQNATQLGKALNDPVKGLTALARSGVTFTEQEKEKIKALVESGKMLEAQDTLLKAIETQVGGTAASTATATFKIGAAFGHVRDVVGTLLLPLFEKFADFMVNKVVPYATKVEEAFGEGGVAGGLKFLATGFLNVTTNMGAFGNAILVLTSLFVAFRAVAIAAAISQNLFNVALLSNPIGIAVAAIIALGVAVVAAYLKFEGFRKVVNAVINGIISTVETFVNTFVDGINLVITAINILIRGANLFGADIKLIGKIGEVEFGRIGSAANGARKQIGSVAEVAGGMAAKEGGLNKIAAALKKVGTEAGGEGGGGTGGAAKAVETAGEKLQKYIDKLKGLTSAQRSYRDSQKGVLKADTDLLEAKTKLADAQAYMNQVLKGYGAGSKQAKDRQKELDKAQRGVERSNYDVEGAVFAVSNAEAELAKLRADPESSAQAIREAEITLAEAKLSVADATDSQTDATNELATAQLLLQEAINGASESSDTYLEAAKALRDAQIAEREATDQQTAAYERQKDALDALTKAQEEATAAKKGVKPADAAAAEAAANAPVIIGGGETPTTAAPISTGNPLMDSVLDRFTGRARELMLERGGFTAFADGGVVTSPMMGLVGEAGSEAIIPLDRLGEFGGQTINITINAGLGADATTIGDEIVNVLQRYNRRNGALPLKVA